MFGLDDVAIGAIGSGLLQGGSSLLGGMFGASGQSATNAQQMAMFQQQLQQQQAQYNASMSYNWLSQANAQDFSNKQMKWAMDNNAYMAGTAYQRAMADMKAAGLNPILAYQQGGANTPTMSGGGGGSGSTMGAPGIPGAPSLGNPGAELGRGVSAAGQAMQAAANTKVALTQANKDQSQVDLNKSTTAYTDANKALTEQLNTKAVQDTATSAAQQKVAEENAANVRADTVNKGINAMILSHDATTAYQKSRLATSEADTAQKWGPGTWGNLGNTAERALGRTIDLFRQGGGLGYDWKPTPQPNLGNTTGPSETPLDITIKRKP